MIREVTDDQFEEAIKEGKVLVDFYSTNCPPCKQLAPMLDALSEDLDSVTFLKVNVDEEMLHASRLSIASVPTLILFEGGKEVKRKTGLLPKPVLRSWASS